MRLSGPANPGLGSIGLGTSSSLNGIVVVNSLDDDYLFRNKQENDLEEGEFELTVHTGDEDEDNTLNDA